MTVQSAASFAQPGPAPAQPDPAVAQPGSSPARSLLVLFTRRVLLSLLLVAVVPTVVYILEALTPGNVAQQILGDTATPAAIQRLEADLGLNKPIVLQYLDWFWNLLHGQLGSSYLTGQSVFSILNQRLPITLSVVAGAVVLSVLIGVPLGVLSSMLRGSRAIPVNVLSALGLAFPSFVLGVILIDLFAVRLRVLPATGYIAPSASLGGWLKSLVLPVLSLSVILITSIAKQTRDQMKDVMTKEFIRNLRARGITSKSIIAKHALRNAMIPVVTVIGLNTVGAIGGTVFVEQIFNLPGLGLGLYNAVLQRDLPVTLGAAFYFTVLIVVVNFLVDAAYAVLDPQVRSKG